MDRKQIIIVGGGPAGLMAADMLSPAFNVSLFDKEKNVGQKFLLAGKGGFNLTNSLRGTELASRYSPAGFLDKALHAFDTEAFRQWLLAMDIPTFVGSSGRVFPEKGIRPVDVLNKIKTKLEKQDVRFFTQHEFVRFDGSRHITFKSQEKEKVFEADYILFALGGASWPVTGSDGSWRAAFESMGVATKTFRASNCGINIVWPEAVRKSHAGKPLKNIRLYTDNFEVRGEALITEYGLEGNAVYPLVPSLRNLLNTETPTIIYIDFKPMNTEAQLLQKAQGENITPKDYVRLFSLNTPQLAVIKAFTDRETYLSVGAFVKGLKKLAVPVDSLRPVEEAISTVGGICLGEVNEDFSLKKYSWVYTFGEMLDWDAPTGGFLLQGCFSMAHYAAASILRKEI